MARFPKSSKQINNNFLWVKFGWSEYYRGEPVHGNFGWLNEHRGKKDEGRGHEAFNFRPLQGTYHCYVPPQNGKYAPWNKHNTGWLVICLAKNPKQTGIHVVGWYENATLIGKWKKLPLRQLNPGTGEESSAYDWSYCITSKSAFFVPPEHRNDPFSDPSVRQGKYRKNVELAAERAVLNYYKKKGFDWERVASLNCGYDYVFTKGRMVYHVEVKGTSTVNEQFFLTRNENKSRNDPRWRLGMVTQALAEQPNVKFYDNRAFKAAFDLKPYVFVGKRIVESENT